MNVTMIIACPACATRYVVPDSAIGVDGRTVRCAKCRHSWFQSGPELPDRPERIVIPQGLAPATAPAAARAESAVPARGQDAPVIDEPRPPSRLRTPSPQPDAPMPPLPPRPVAAPHDPDSAARRIYADGEMPREFSGDDFAESPSSFDYQPPFRPRRNPLKLYTIAASIFAVVALGAVGAVAWYGLPDWAPFARETFATAQPDLQLEFPPGRQDRRTLPNGAEFFGASGKVTNVGKERRTVPPILIVLRDSDNRIVYSWEVLPPKRQLNPGESVTINEAVTDVPRSAKFAEIGWKPG